MDNTAYLYLIGLVFSSILAMFLVGVILLIREIEKLRTDIAALKQKHDSEAVKLLVKFIRLHKSTLQQPPVPMAPSTLRWLDCHGISLCDAEVQIYKYLEQALDPSDQIPERPRSIPDKPQPGRR